MHTFGLIAYVLYYFCFFSYLAIIWLLSHSILPYTNGINSTLLISISLYEINLATQNQLHSSCMGPQIQENWCPSLSSLGSCCHGASALAMFMQQCLFRFTHISATLFDHIPPRYLIPPIWDHIPPGLCYLELSIRRGCGWDLFLFVWNVCIPPLLLKGIWWMWDDPHRFMCWMLGSQLVALFQEVVETLAGRAQLEEGRLLGQCLWRLCLDPGPSLRFLLPACHGVSCSAMPSPPWWPETSEAK